MTEREKERAAVVAWLRKRKQWELDYAGAEGLADDIEAGEHLKGDHMKGTGDE